LLAGEVFEEIRGRRQRTSMSRNDGEIHSESALVLLHGSLQSAVEVAWRSIWYGVCTQRLRGTCVDSNWNTDIFAMHRTEKYIFFIPLDVDGTCQERRKERPRKVEGNVPWGGGGVARGRQRGLHGWVFIDECAIGGYNIMGM
jgi:hypothetical protein